MGYFVAGGCCGCAIDGGVGAVGVAVALGRRSGHCVDRQRVRPLPSVSKTFWRSSLVMLMEKLVRFSSRLKLMLNRLLG
jgi:hypothetical protein